MVRTEAMRASIEWLDFALYERNMAKAEVGPKTLARNITWLGLRSDRISLDHSACCHFKCMLQCKLGRVNKHHMAELIETIKRLSDDAVAAHLEHHLFNTPRTID